MLWEGGQAYLSTIFNKIDILLYPVSTVELSMAKPGENFKMKVLRWLENAILIKVLANTIQKFPITVHSFNYCTNVM